MADTDIERIIAAGREAGRAQPTLRFSTKEEYEVWREKQTILHYFQCFHYLQCYYRLALLSNTSIIFTL